MPPISTSGYAMILPTSVATYRRGDLPQVRVLNMYAERAETVPGKVVLFPRPGMSFKAQLSASAILGLFQQAGVFDGATFAVAGGVLYRGNAAAGSLSASRPVQFASADNALLIAGDSALYRYNGSTTSPIAFPDGAGVSSVAYLGGYAVAARAGSRRFYYTLDSSVWDGLDYLAAEQSTDSIVGLAVVIDQLWVFCERHVEVFYLTGDADAPFQRVQGRVFDKGARYRDTIVNLDNTVQWLGDDGIVYRAEGVPLRVSDHGIEDVISTSTAASAWTYTWKGHLFYVLALDDATLVYDVATKLWTEAGSIGGDTWRATQAVQIGAEVVVGDAQEGILWNLTDGRYADGDELLPRIFTLLANERGFIDNLFLDCSAGDLPAPNDAAGLIELRSSRDGGRAWTDWRQASLGRQGKRRTSARFGCLGLVDRDGMVIQVRITDPVASRVSNVRINETGGGRSR